MTSDATPPPPASPPTPTRARSGDGAPLRRIDSQELLRGAQEVEIDHGGFIYRLRRTSLGKLILTK